MFQECNTKLSALELGLEIVSVLHLLYTSMTHMHRLSDAACLAIPNELRSKPPCSCCWQASMSGCYLIGYRQFFAALCW